MRRVRRVAWFVAAGAAMALIGASFYLGALDNIYVGRSRQPVLENGWVVPYSVKGVTVYLTPSEVETVGGLSRACLSLAAVVILGGIVGGFGPKPPP
jgi:hypothetical protein